MKKKLLAFLLLFISYLTAQAQLSRFDLNFDRQVSVSDITTLANIVLGQTDSILYGDKRIILHCAQDSIFLPTAQIDSISFDQGEGTNLTLHTDTLTLRDTLYLDTLVMTDTLIVTEYDTITKVVTEVRTQYQTVSSTQALDNLANVTFIPIYGQSLGEGIDAIPLVTSECKYFSSIMFNTGLRNPCVSDTCLTGFVPLTEYEDIEARLGETVASGCAERLTELFCSQYDIASDSSFWSDHKFLFGEFGLGGLSIAELTEESDTTITYYQGLVNGVKAAKSICDSLGWTLSVPGFIWMQGETDQRYKKSKEYYQDMLVSLQQKFSEAVKDITQQQNDVLCFCYQISSQNSYGPTRKPTYGDVTMEIPTAQMELIQKNELFRGAAPTYILDFKNYVHLTAFGEKLMGAYYARAIYEYLSGKPDPSLLIHNIWTTDNSVIITCNDYVAVDSTWVSLAENLGFTLINSSNEQLITSATTVDNCIVLNCSQSPIGSVLYYGFNGKEKSCGRQTGSRGNIRKADAEPQTFMIGESCCQLYDYLYSFYTKL